MAVLKIFAGLIFTAILWSIVQNKLMTAKRKDEVQTITLQRAVQGQRKREGSSKHVWHRDGINHKINQVKESDVFHEIYLKEIERIEFECNNRE